MKNANLTPRCWLFTLVGLLMFLFWAGCVGTVAETQKKGIGPIADGGIRGSHEAGGPARDWVGLVQAIGPGGKGINPSRWWNYQFVLADSVRVQDVIYDSSRPVTGIISNLQGLFFERVILPVVITVGDENKPFTVYSVKSVEPQVIRAYGLVRYADSVEQARQKPLLGDNAIIVPVSAITKENMIMIGFDAARIIRETPSHGNGYLKNAKVIIATK